MQHAGAIVDKFDNNIDKLGASARVCVCMYLMCQGSRFVLGSLSLDFGALIGWVLMRDLHCRVE